jgi:hypothetical protein
MEEVKCSNPACTWNVLTESQDGNWRFTTRALKTKGEGKVLVAVCRRCGAETVLPYTLQKLPKDQVPERKRPRRRGFTVIHKPVASGSLKEGS